MSSSSVAFFDPLMDTISVTPYNIAYLQDLVRGAQMLIREHDMWSEILATELIFAEASKRTPFYNMDGLWTASGVLEAYIARAGQAHQATNCFTEVRTLYQSLLTPNLPRSH